MMVDSRKLIPVFAAVLSLTWASSVALATQSNRVEATAPAVDETGPVPKSTPLPVYPEFARKALIDGTVVLQILVNADGVVRNVKVIKGVSGIDQAAVDIVKQWTFWPARKNGEPVAAWTTVPFVFKVSATLSAGPPSASPEVKTVPGLPKAYNLNDLTIELNRTGCFGTCPSYRLVLRGSGDCTYVGASHVLQQGEVSFHLEPSAVVDLLNDLYGMEFFRFSDFYVEREMVRALPDGTVEHSFQSVSDDPHQIVTVQIGPYTKRVEKNFLFGPKELVTFAEKVDAITKSSQWIHAQPVPR